MNKSGFLLILCFCFLMTSKESFSQEGVATNKTDSNTSVKQSRDEKKGAKRYMLIYHKNTKGILYGNPCMMEVTRSMGFEYAVAPKGTKGYRTEAGRVVHNFGVKTVLFVKNPFWKIKVNRKLKECRIKTGDYTG